MHWIDQALAQFCQDLGVVVPAPAGALIQLEFEESGTLQLERHERKLTLWLAVDLAWHQVHQGAIRALALTFSRTGPALPMRCAWASGRLLLLITLDERRVTAPVLHQALRTLSSARRAVLEP
ncbi:type III secretion chaperone SycN [Pseudomonas sp. NPDC087598]|uniref:type III secretion chaperone SycN n=1 Tax=Pseudomonas sp. NPDC087598 TaxID=3364440 RepID=UPI00382C2270